MTKQRILPSLLLTLMLSLTALCTACTEVEQTSYKTLVVAAHTYDATMQALANAEAQDLITEDQYALAKDLARIYYAAFHSARVALESYVTVTEASPSAEDEALLLSTIATMTLRLTELTSYVSEIGVAIENLSE